MVSMTKASLLATTETDLRVVIENLNSILNKVDLGIQLNMALTLVELSEVRPDGSLAVKASGGGMPPLYVFRADGRLEEFMVAGLPLGVTNEAVYALTEFQLQPGDTLLLMSDGLLEMFNYNLEFLSFDRLMASLRELDVRTLSAPEILQAVANIGHAWAKGHPLYDDVTLLVLKVK
jgi:serine phosphatase RsbU (regulator of sigma subunit)